jgi:membrane protein implicated in regulation of membrane protease activity
MTMDYINQHPAWWWLGLGIALLVLEMLSGTMFFLFVSAGAFLVAALTWGLNLGGVGQGICFAISVVLALTVWRRLRPNPGDRIELRAAARGLNNRLAGFIGREAVLEEALVNGNGRLRLDDSYWNIVGDDIPSGSRVRVVSIEGMILRVQAI